MLHVPTINETIILVVIITGAQTTIITIIHLRQEVAVLIFRMEEAGLRIEDIPVIISATQVILRLIVIAQLLGDLRQAPLIVSRTQSNSDRLTFLPDRDIRNSLLLSRA